MSLKPLTRLGSAGSRRLGIKIHTDREPTRAELEGAVRRHGLSAIRLTEPAPAAWTPARCRPAGAAGPDPPVLRSRTTAQR